MRVTFAAIPAYGHLLPVLPLAAAFAQAGHEVEVGADRSFARLLPVPFFQVVPEGMTLHQAEQEAKAQIVDRADPMGFGRAMFGVVMPHHMAPRLLARWAELGPPDLVIHESSALGAAMAARDAGVPCVADQGFLTPWAWSGTRSLPCRRPRGSSRHSSDVTYNRCNRSPKM
jgi:UDP:flavonoid glycosyltransferase YjiC (YdhE family)